MAVGTPFHSRTEPLVTSLRWKQWSGYFVAVAYNDFHDPEYNAIRTGAGLIDVSPLYKYDIEGPDAERLVDKLITRDASKCQVGQVLYAAWCDEALGEGIGPQVDGHDRDAIGRRKRRQELLENGVCLPPVLADLAGRRVDQQDVIARDRRRRREIYRAQRHCMPGLAVFRGISQYGELGGLPLVVPHLGSNFVLCLRRDFIFRIREDRTSLADAACDSH